MTVFSSDDKPDPFVPACLSNSPGQYDATIELFFVDDTAATEKRAVVRKEVPCEH